jgi:hypothetical protein
MHSLKELKDFLINKEIEVKEFGGWYLKVGKDTWTMSHDCFYKNGNIQSLKEKGLFDNYKRKKQDDNSSTQTRNWRGIGGRNVLRDGEHD